MKVQSTVVKERWIRCGLEIKIKFDSVSLTEAVNLELLKGAVVGHAKVKFVDDEKSKGFLDIHIFQK